MSRAIHTKWFALGVAAALLVCVYCGVACWWRIENIRHLNSDALSRIDTDRNQYSFGVIGDSRSSVEIFDEVKHRLNAENLLFTVDLGDLVYKAEDYRYDYFIRSIEDLDAPLLTVVGNHDIKGDPDETAFTRYLGDRYYAFTVGGCRMIALDNAKGSIPLEEMNWLERELDGVSPTDCSIVFAHIPLFDPREGHDYGMDDPEEALYLQRMFDAHGVDLILTGHIHAVYEGMWGQTPYVITGGAGSKLRGTGPQNNYYNYLTVSVADGNVSYEVHPVPAPDSRTEENFEYELALFTGSYLPLALLAPILALAIPIWRRKGWINVVPRPPEN